MKCFVCFFNTNVFNEQVSERAKDLNWGKSFSLFKKKKRKKEKELCTVLPSCCHGEEWREAVGHGKSVQAYYGVDVLVRGICNRGTMELTSQLIKITIILTWRCEAL